MEVYEVDVLVILYVAEDTKEESKVVEEAMVVAVVIED